jgi:hypothetical protein
LPLVSLKLLANLPPVSTALAKLVENFAAGTPWCTLNCKYLREFSKILKMFLMEYSGAEGKLIHEKNQKQKIS